MKKTSVPNPVKILGYITCYSWCSPRPVKSPSNSIRYNCEKICSSGASVIPRDFSNIHTTGSSCRDALPCANMELKLPQYFYLLMEKPLGRFKSLPSLVSLPSGGTVQAENTYSHILKVTVQV